MLLTSALSYKLYYLSSRFDKLGLRGSRTCEFELDNCKVPVKNALGGMIKGSDVLFSGLDLDRLILTGSLLGAMQRVCDKAFAYVHQNKIEIRS